MTQPKNVKKSVTQRNWHNSLKFEQNNIGVSALEPEYILLFTCSGPSTLGWNFGDVNYTFDFWTVRITFGNCVTIKVFITIFLYFRCFVHTSPKFHSHALGPLQVEGAMYSGSNALTPMLFCSNFGELCQFLCVTLFFHIFRPRRVMWKTVLRCNIPSGYVMVVLSMVHTVWQCSNTTHSCLSRSYKSETY